MSLFEWELKTIIFQIKDFALGIVLKKMFGATWKLHTELVTSRLIICTKKDLE